jgi:peptidoglycan/xylan/chitin deacetylase (PgdA/CDA1 family)
MAFVVNFHKADNPVWFEKIVSFLKNKYIPVHLTELLSLYNNNDELDKICHITVDDGDKSFYKWIYPVLRKHQIPASTFVSPETTVNQLNFWFQEIVGYEKQKLLLIFSEVTGTKTDFIKEYPIGDILKCLTIETIWEIIKMYQKKYNPGKRSWQNMSIDELKEVENSGLITIGAHTLRHPILANEEMGVSKNEIVSSINNMANILGHEIKYFAYPNGLPVYDFGQREMDILNDCGCLCSFSTISGNFNLKTDLLSIPRYGFSCNDSIAFSRMKFFFGSNWSIITKLKPGNESVNRKALLKLLGK